jgi:hypothetical protein
MENNTITLIATTITAIAASAGVIVAAIATRLTNKSINENNKNHEKQVFKNKIFSLINIHNVTLSRFREINILDNSERIDFYGHAAISFWLGGFTKEKGNFTGFYDGGENALENRAKANKCRNVDSDNCKANFYLNPIRSSFCFIDNVIVILSLIKNNEEKLTKEEENFYLELLHAQISKEELVVIFYYIHAYKEDKKPLFEKYAFFENIDEQLLFNWQEEISIYKKEVYGTSVLASYVKES